MAAQPTQFVFIVRHGERMDNTDPFWKEKVPWGKERPYDPPLTEVGKCQATELGEVLKGEHIRYVVSSPFFRCLQTAQQIANVVLDESKIGIYNRLCELLHPCCGIQEKPKVPAKDLTSHGIFVDKKVGIEKRLPTFPESYHTAGDRFVEAIHDVADKHWPHSIVLVSHGYSVTEAAYWVRGERPFGAHYCSWLKVERASKREEFTFVKSKGIY